MEGISQKEGHELFPSVARGANWVGGIWHFPQDFEKFLLLYFHWKNKVNVKYLQYFLQ